MLEMFTDGLQLKFSNISKYDGKNRMKPISYLLVLVLGISLILLGYQYSQIKISPFEAQMAQAGVQVKNNKVTATKEELSEWNQTAPSTGVELTQAGLTIKNVGEVSFDVLTDFSGQKEEGESLAELLKKSSSDLYGIIFLTLYLKTLPFILLAIIGVMLLSRLLKRNVVSRDLSKGEAFQMAVSLSTIPALAYLCLRAADLKDSMTLFIFVAVLVMINFFYSRQVNLGFSKEDDNHEK